MFFFFFFFVFHTWKEASLSLHSTGFKTHNENSFQLSTCHGRTSRTLEHLLSSFLAPLLRVRTRSIGNFHIIFATIIQCGFLPKNLKITPGRRKEWAVTRALSSSAMCDAERDWVENKDGISPWRGDRRKSGLARRCANHEMIISLKTM